MFMLILNWLSMILIVFQSKTACWYLCVDEDILIVNKPNASTDHVMYYLGHYCSTLSSNLARSQFTNLFIVCVFRLMIQIVPSVFYIIPSQICISYY